MRKLRQFVDANHVLLRVVKPLLGGGQQSTKLGYIKLQNIGAKNRAEFFDDARTLHGQSEVITRLRFVPTNSLLEFFAAARTFDGPKILIPVHSLKPLKNVH
jgi:hypothetical protein